jgi:hypothetical protein
MKTFQSQDMQKQASTLQEAAMLEPVLITYRDRPRLVMMSIDHYERLLGAQGDSGRFSRETARRIASLPNKVTSDFLIAYSRDEISRNEAMKGIGMDPADVAAFAALMNSNGIPWPKADREQAEREADGLLAVLEGNDA